MTENFSSANAWSEGEGTGRTEPVYGSGPGVGGTGGMGVDQSATGSGAGQSTTGAVKGETAGVAGQAADSARHVVGVAQDEAGAVAAETASQVRDLLHQTRSELSGQAAAQQQKVAEGLRSISKELESMAASSDEPGPASDLVRQAAQRSSSVATWLDARDPGSLVEEVKTFARQRPVAFLAIAAGAGMLAGRLTRGLSAGAPQSRGGSGRSPGVQGVGAQQPPVVPVEPVVYGTPAVGGGVYDGPASTGATVPVPGVAPSAPLVEEVPVVDPFEGGGSR